MNSNGATISGHTVSVAGAATCAAGVVDRLCDGVPPTEGLRHGPQGAGGIPQDTDRKLHHTTYLVG